MAELVFHLQSLVQVPRTEMSNHKNIVTINLTWKFGNILLVNNQTVKKAGTMLLLKNRIFS